ncbi:amyloid protein A [Hyalella azteca]|uniref:Amyloid protein A n=1 Tax=Hyalella azteca TaxID=294128 RepID=A0A979FH62_HYAAZ|nr:amyloid protein A [Hyalella azteca]
MRLILASLVLVALLLQTEACNHVGEAMGGAMDMIDAYQDMHQADYVGADKYFHARGNRDAASRGPGGRWAAEKISDAKEWFDQIRGDPAADSEMDQEANRLGRDGGDISVLLPPGMDEPTDD